MFYHGDQDPLVNNMVAGVLATWGARASVAMLSIWFSWNILVLSEYSGYSIIRVKPRPIVKSRKSRRDILAWRRHQMETFSALLAISVGNSPVPGDSPRTKASDTELWCFDLRLNNRLGKQLSGWLFETLSRPLWRHCNGCCLGIKIVF